MKDKIAEIIKAARNPFITNISDENYAEVVLALFPSLEGIVVVEECTDEESIEDFMKHCPQDQEGCEMKIVKGKGMRQCSGTISRPAEWGDIDNAKIIRWIKAFMIIADQGNIELFEGEDLLLHLQNLADDALTTKAGGRLRIKEKI